MKGETRRCSDPATSGLKAVAYITGPKTTSPRSLRTFCPILVQYSLTTICSQCKAIMGLCHEVGARCIVFAADGNKQVLRMPLHWSSNSIILPSRHLLSLSRHHATSGSPGAQKTATRKQVTIRNDDGRVEWKELTIGEKVARTTQQTFNFGVVLAGLAGTV